MSELIHKAFNLLTRKKIQVGFNDLSSPEPVSSEMGCDRGTPISHYYIEKFLKSRKDHIQGDVMEVASDSYIKRFGGDSVESIEVLHVTPDNPKATIVGDLTKPESLPQEIVDCFVCTQTFNFISDVEKAVEGAYNVLKPGGVLLATTSGISQISRYDMERWGHYWNLTTASMENLFNPVFNNKVEIDSYGNVVAALALLQGICVEDLPEPSLLDHNDPDYQVVITALAQK